ncbi:hypothetical protein FOZ63_019339, partial [Perkinsus olseni]
SDSQQHYHPRTVTPDEFAEFRDQVGNSLKGLTDALTSMTSQLTELQASRVPPAVVNPDQKLPTSSAANHQPPPLVLTPERGPSVHPDPLGTPPSGPVMMSGVRMAGVQPTPRLTGTFVDLPAPTGPVASPPSYGQPPTLNPAPRMAPFMSNAAPITSLSPGLTAVTRTVPERRAVWGSKVFSEVLASVRKSAKLPGGPYKGTGDSRCLGEFLRELEIDLTFAAGDEVWKLAFLLNMLSHGVRAEILQAYEAMQQCPLQGHLAEGRYGYALQAVQTLLRQVYSTADDRRQVINKFNALSVGGGTIEQYDYQFDLLRTEVQIISGQPLSEDTVIAHYLNGLGQRAQRFAEVHLSSVTTFGELRRRIRAFWKSETKYKQTPVSLAECGTGNKAPDVHGAAKYYESTASAASASGSAASSFPCGQGCGHHPPELQKGNCLRCAKPRHRARWCRQPEPADVDRRCGVCGCREHRRETCPFKGDASHCPRCGKIGHRAAVCREVVSIKAASTSPPQPTGSDRRDATNCKSATSPATGAAAAGSPMAGTVSEEETAHDEESETLEEFLSCLGMETTQLTNQDSHKSDSHSDAHEVFMYNLSFCPKANSDTTPLKKSTVVSVLLDTGAGKSFVSESWLKTHSSLVHDYKRSAKSLKVRCANGSVFCTGRLVSLMVSHGGRTNTWWFYVTKHLSHAVICGMDFLRGLRFTLKLSPGSQEVSTNAEQGEAGYSISSVATTLRSISQRSEVTLLALGQDTVPCSSDKRPQPEADETLVGIVPDDAKLPNSHPEPVQRHVHRIPWVSEARPNRRRSLRRAKQMSMKLEEKLKKDPDAYRQCCEQIEMLVQRGFARPASEDEINHAYGLLVVRRATSSTTPLRVVLDGSTLRGFVSAGVIYDRSVVSPLLVLRRYAFFTLADLEKAFYSLSIVSTDCGAQGYYWAGRWYMLLRAGMGLPSSPSMLQTSIRATLAEFDSQVAPTLSIGPYCVRSFMDDIAQGASSVHGREQLADGVNSTVNKNGFSEQQRKRIQNHVNGLNADDDKAGALFGVQWDPQNDALSLAPVAGLNHHASGARESSPLTLRKYISWLNSHFDPMGLRLEEAMAGRQLLRTAVRSGISLDESLSAELRDRARLLQEGYERASATPRFVQGDTLVVACDASLVGWACTVTDTHGTRLYARGGLHDAGHEGWSIPRLELYALVEARKIIDGLLRDDPVVKKIILVSDSEINVQRLTSRGSISKKLVPWDVRTIASMRQWLHSVPVVLGHVRGAGNPADCASRALFPNSYDADLYQSAISVCEENFDRLRERLATPASDEMNDNPLLDAIMLSVTDDSPDDDREDDPNIASIEEKVLTAQSDDPYCQQIRKVLAHEPVELSTSEAQRIRRTYIVDTRGNICRAHAVCGSQYFVPLASRSVVVSMLHDLYAHPGANKLYCIVLKTYHLYWPKMVRDIRQWTASCRVCVTSRRQRAEPPSFGSQLRSSQLWELLAVDIGGPYVGTTVTTGGTAVPSYSLILTESVTRYVVARELPSKSGKDVSKVLEQCFWEFGFPMALASDADVVLCQGEVRSFCKKYGVVCVPHPPYGAIRAWWEPGHHLLHLSLRQLIAANNAAETDWVRFLPQAVWVCNNATLPLASADGERFTPCDLVRLCGSSPPPSWRPTNEMTDELKAYLHRHYADAGPSRQALHVRQARQVEAIDSFKDYLRSWDVHRLRLLDNLDASKRCRQPAGDAIACSDIVRVYRPSTKLNMSWSSRLYKVMEIRAQIARLRPECAKVGQADEVQYVFNLARATDVDASEVADRFADPQPLPKEIHSSQPIVLLGLLEGLHYVTLRVAENADAMPLRCLFVYARMRISL